MSAGRRHDEPGRLGTPPAVVLRAGDDRASTCSGSPAPASVRPQGTHALSAPSRLAALALAGATPSADATFDAFARMVRRLLDVPMALVSLVDDHRQCLVGATGLPSPLDEQRQTPLSHSFCQHVVRSGLPLVVPDALVHPELRENGAVRDLGVIAYAGMPLTSEDGQVLGSLAAIDHRARLWTAAELSVLQELASACSTELRLRAETRRLQMERDASERLRQELVVRNTHLTLLTGLSIDVAQSLDFAAIARSLSDHLASAHGGWAAAYADDGGQLDTQVESSTLESLPDLLHVVTALGPEAPRLHDAGAGMAVVETADDQRLLPLRDRAGIERVIVAPISGRIASGHAVVALAADGRDADDVTALVADMIRTAALALDNAALLARHRRTAETLQRQLLSDVPQFEGTVLAATYQAASDDAAIGGDWYDAFRHPDGAYWLVIGDVMGHDLHAAGRMARLQHFVRAVAVDADKPPHVVLERIDALLEHHDADVYATCVVMRITTSDAPDGRVQWRVEWSNAGHLPPMRQDACGVEPLAVTPDLLLGVGRPGRHTHTSVVRPGSRLILFTDGLVERRDRPVDEGLSVLQRALSGTSGSSPIEACATVVEAMVQSRSEDDVALIVIDLQTPPHVSSLASPH